MRRTGAGLCAGCGPGAAVLLVVALLASGAVAKRTEANATAQSPSSGPGPAITA